MTAAKKAKVKPVKIYGVYTKRGRLIQAHALKSYLSTMYVGATWMEDVEIVPVLITRVTPAKRAQKESGR